MATIQTALAAGDLGTAYENLNKLALFGIQNSLLPILSGTIFSSTTVMGIPQQMAQNFADAVGAFFTTGTLVFGAFQAVYAPVSGAVFEASRAVEGFSAALSSGDVRSAVNALVNLPAVVADGFINGFDYDDAGTTAPWAGLLSSCTGKTGRCAAGPIEQFLVTIPKRIAAAIANPVATPTAAVASGVAATALPSSSASVQTFDLKVGDDASEAAADASKTVAPVTDEKEAVDTVTKSTTTTKVAVTTGSKKKPATASSDDSSSSSAKAGDSGPKHAKGSGAKSAKSAS